MEGVALKFKRLGCSFLESIDIESDSGCVNDLFILPTQERRTLLSWCLSKIDGSLESMRQEDFLVAAGIFKSTDAASRFVSGDLSKNKQVTIWKAIGNLVEEETPETEEILAVHSNNCRFSDALASNVSFNTQNKDLICVTPYNLERELKGRKHTEPPKIDTFRNILKVATSEQKNLLKFENIQNVGGAENEKTLVEINEKGHEVTELKKVFDTKFAAELEPWLTGRNVSFSGAQDRPEVKCTFETLPEVSDYFSNNLKITNSAHNVNKHCEEIATSLSSDQFKSNSILDLNLCDVLNSSRAPEAL